MYIKCIHTHTHKYINIYQFFLKGVIFAIDFTDDGKKLCSVSDDRTLRVWTVNDK